MSSLQIALLGAIAGFTIFLGLPIARIRKPSVAIRALLNALAIGILLFLLWDVLSHGIDPVESALLAAANTHEGSWWRFAGLASVFTVGLAVGLMSLAYYERWMGSRARRERTSTGGPGAMSVDETPSAAGVVGGAGSAARRLALLIAVGIGLHNFSEGLAIGQSAASGEISLAVLLIVGFGLHNATEGFGITGPLTAEQVRPSWGFLGLLGVIGGGPTLLGTLIGQSFVNDTVYLGFLALAAGSILYVILQLLRVAFRLGRIELLYWGLLLGLLAGFATDFVVSVAGG